MSINKQQIEASLMVVYQKNLTFLKENFYDIFLNVNNLSLDIMNGKHKEIYSLEIKDGYFDILNIDINGYFYATNSYQDAENRAKKASFDTNNSINLLRQNPNTGKLTNFEMFKDVTPVIDYLNKNLDFENIEFKKIYKKVYIGTGLGLHIQEIDKRISSYNTLIIEEELEIFRLSLFLTDYTLFQEGNRKLFLSIGTDKIKRKKDIEGFANYHKYMNYNIKYNILLENNYHIKDEIVQYFDLNNVAGFPYKEVLKNFDKLVGFIKNKEKFLNRFKMKEKEILNNKKVLLISAGPSVDGYIDWIKENQEKFIIICVDIVVKKLEIHGIVPDILVSIDGHPIVSTFLTTKNKDFLNNTIFVLLSQQCDEIMEVIKSKNYYFSQVMNLVNEIGYIGTVPNVGTFSYMVAVILGAKELYLIGNDAAFNQETGNRYSKNTGADSSVNILVDNIDETKDSDMSIVNQNDIIEVKGNLREVVKTNRELYRFKSTYDESANYLKGNAFVSYNLSDGAYIEGMIPLTKKELIDKVKNYIEDKSGLREKFEEISQTIDNLTVDNDIRIINSIITKVKSFQKIKMKSKDDFLANKLDLMIWILDKSKNVDYKIYGNFFLHYTELVDIYINFMLNLKQKNLDSKKVINDICKMWTNGIIELFKDIKNTLK